MAERILTVRVTGQEGEQEAVNAWCLAAAKDVAAQARAAGVTLFRYRMMNLPSATILLDGGDAASQQALAQALQDRACKFERLLMEGEEIARAARPDVGPDMRDLPVLNVVWFTAPDGEGAAELGRWYDKEHIPMLLECPAWAATRRFRVLGSPRPGFTTFAALHYLKDTTALTSPERDAARATPWRDRLAKNDWFRGTYRVFLRERDLPA